MLKSILCNSIGAYILGSGTIRVPDIGTTANLNNRRNKIIKMCALFTECISEKNDTQIDNTKDIDIAMLMYNLS